ARCRQAPEPGQLARLRGAARLRTPVYRPADPLGVTLDVTPHREPKRVRGPGDVAQLRERDRELGGPPERVDLRADVPYRVPSVVLLAVVVHRVITLHAGRVHGELETRAPVVIRVHHD